MPKAKVGDRVRIQYSRLPERGAAPDKPRGPRMVEFTVGNHDVISSVSLGVVGMAPGERKRLMLQPEEAYGTVRPGLIKEIARKCFPKQLVLRVGKRLTAVNSASGRRWRVRVVELKPESVVVDGNHSLAGRVVELEISLVSLQSPKPNDGQPQTTWETRGDRLLRAKHPPGSN